jgi:hypothetical protein
VEELRREVPGQIVYPAVVVQGGATILFFRCEASKSPGNC